MDGILGEVLSRAAQVGRRGVVVFDLDSTLLDNRPRQARIFRDFAAAGGPEELARARPEHWRGWDLRVPLARLGLSPERIEAVLPGLKEFWRERFFTSEYCRDDVPLEGAAPYVAAVARTGAQIVYLTGRHEPMRPGTVEVLGRFGFPVPPGNGAAVHLVMKPSLEQSDDDFKAAAHARVPELGQVVAAFDNEPIHANDLARSFPGALVVHLDTDHSGRQVALLPGIPSIPGFAAG